MSTETTQEAVTRYRQKSADVEAIQLTHESGPRIWKWAGATPTYGDDNFVNGLMLCDGVHVREHAGFGDWIVKFPAGAFRVIAPDKFDAAFEPATPRADADPMWQQAYMDVQKVLDQALGAEEEDGTGGGIASEVWLLAHQRDGARAERDRLRNGGRELGKSVVRLTRSMQAARIEMIQNGPGKAMQWILSSIPDVDDNDPEDQWNGTESAGEWFDRTREAAK